MLFLLRNALLILALVLVPSGAGAQTLPDGAVLNLTVVPEYPRPYEEVTVSVGSTFINLATSDITFSVNGSVVEEGERSTTLVMGASGKRTEIKVTVVAPDGTYTAEKTLIPAEIALIVEPTSSVPPFYEGMPLVPSEGEVRIVALPEFTTSSGTRVANDAISYTWKLDDKILESNSGLGKNVLFAIAPPRYRDATITVIAQTRDSSLTASASTLISPVDPIIRIYAKDPLQGVLYGRALGSTYTLQEAEETFTAVPFFFASLPTIVWSLNGEQNSTAEDITVRASGGSGTAVLEAVGELEETGASQSFSVMFGESRPTGIFGF